LVCVKKELGNGGSIPGREDQAGRGVKQLKGKEGPSGRKRGLQKSSERDTEARREESRKSRGAGEEQWRRQKKEWTG